MAVVKKIADEMLLDMPDLPDGWASAPLSTLVDERGISYGIVQPGSEDQEGVPIVRVNNLKEHRIITDDAMRVSRDIEAKYGRTRLRGGEVLLSLVGSLGEIAVVPRELAGWNVARAIGVIPVRSDVGAEWVSICLRSVTVQHYIRTWATTTVQATLNLRDVANLPIPMPPKHEREAIAHILGTLDDKIELNRKMNQTLETMARAIFKSWFVEFDPVRAKAEGRDPGLPADLAALFPDRFEDSEMGEIPKGWRVATVDEEFNLTMGQSPPGETYNETGNGLPFFQGRSDFGFRFPKKRVFCSAPTRFAEKGDTLVSVRAPVGDINMAAERCCVGRGVAAIRHKTGARSYTYYSMSSQEEAFARFEAEGTVFGSIGKKDFHGLACVTPSSDIVIYFERVVGTLDEQIQTNEAQTNTLAALRDALLPKLLSGELRVKG